MNVSRCLPFTLVFALMACGSSGTPPAVGGNDGGGQGGAGGSPMLGVGSGGSGNCGDLPACLADLFNSGCFPSTTAGPCTKSMSLGATTGTYTYCFANGKKLVIVADNASGNQTQTYADAAGTCFTETVVPNGPYTYFDFSGSAVASGMTTVSAGVPTVTITCTGGQPVVVTDPGSCAFNISLCTTSPSCQ
jgi:hypothetical protein